MFAVTAASTDPQDPLAGLRTGEVADPAPPEGWEVVRVRAAGLNHHDVWTLRGVGIDPGRLPIVLGCDAAGTTADGREVVVHAVVGEDSFGAGSSILSEQYDGTQAELLAVPSRNLVDKPPGLTFEEAACLPTAWLTAYRMLFVQGGLRPGQRVLVQGVGGGVATAAIMLARAAGLRVYATSRDEGKRDRAAALGAHGVFAPGARLPERVEAVIETVGEATFSHSLKALEPGGVVVVAGATAGHLAEVDLRRVFYRQLRVVGSTMGTRGELVELLRLLDASGVRPLIDQVLPLAEAASAYRRMVEGDVFGKLVLVP
jgi:NADPH:quinone reductase-like Zn-dependent oxidoreductase